MLTKQLPDAALRHQQGDRQTIAIESYLHILGQAMYIRDVRAFSLAGQIVDFVPMACQPSSHGQHILLNTIGLVECIVNYQTDLHLPLQSERYIEAQLFALNMPGYMVLRCFTGNL